MNKITSYFADYQTFPSLFELEPVAGKKVMVDFSALEFSSLGGLPLVREYEKSSKRIIERLKRAIKKALKYVQNNNKNTILVAYSKSILKG